MPTLDTDYVIGRLGDIPGKRLLAVREVGLPFWSLNIETRIQDKKQIPVLEEFVLRSMEAGLKSPTDIQEFLGVSPDIVEDTMANLYSRGLIVPVRAASTTTTNTYVLTLKGSSTCSELSESVPRTVQLEFCFDGLTHNFEMIPESERLRPRDLKSMGLLEIPPFPADSPEVSPVDTGKLRRAFMKTEAATRGAELLKAIGISGKRTRFFIKAVALVFRSNDDPSELSIIFAIDGRRSEVHERAFDEAEGLKKLGIVDSLKQSEDPASGVISDSILRQRSTGDEHEDLRRLTRSLREQTRTLDSRGPSDGESPDPEAQEKYDALSQELEAAENKLNAEPARLLDVSEHPPYLDKALVETTKRLLIVSPWLRDAVIDHRFLKKLQQLLENGVDVKIAYGIGSQQKEGRLDKLGRQALVQLEEQFENLKVARLGNTHAKVLISDEKFVIVTSFNWLSFKGDPDRPFRDERGTLVSIPSEVCRIYDDYNHKFSESLATN